MRAVLVDAGPLVALLDADDAHHRRCVAALKKLRDPLVTVWPPFVEAMYLMRFSVRAQDALWQLIEGQTLALLPLDAEDAPPMRRLMAKYASLPMDLADAALVWVAERERIDRVFTLDKRDFSVYRIAGRRRLELVP